MSREGDDPDDDREGDGADDEFEYPSYTWEGGEEGWTADDESTDRGGRTAEDRPRRDERERSADEPAGRRRTAETPAERRRTTDEPEERRRADRQPRDGRRRERSGGRRDPAGDPEPRRTGTRTDRGSTPTREGVGWNFDSTHQHHGARRDEHERRRRRERPPAEQPPTTDGVKHIDFDRKGAFDFSFSYPFQRGWGALLKTGAIVLLSPLLVFLPLVFVFGYVFRVTRYAAQGRDQPAFEEFGEMLTDGVGYALTFTLATAVWVGAMVAGAALHEAIAWIFGLAGLYLLPAALTVYPVTGSVTKTFSSSLTFDFAFSTHYVKHYLLYILLLVVLRIVASFSVLLFIVGVAWGWAFTYLAIGAYWGFVYYRGVSEGVVPSASDVDQRSGY